MCVVSLRSVVFARAFGGNSCVQSGAMWGNVGRRLNRVGVLSKGFPLDPTVPLTMQPDSPTTKT